MRRTRTKSSLSPAGTSAAVAAFRSVSSSSPQSRTGGAGVGVEAPAKARFRVLAVGPVRFAEGLAILDCRTHHGQPVEVAFARELWDSTTGGRR
jgi:hypothetical protein